MGEILASFSAMSEEKDIFHAHLRRTGNKITSQRDVILEVFLRANGHLSAEELYQLAKAEDPMLGFTTVYRTMKLLVDAGLAREERFGDTHTRYEYGYKREHHDHLICEGCGLVIEFYNEFIEREQDRITDEFGFQATHHSLRIFGLCGQCRQDKPEPPAR